MSPAMTKDRVRLHPSRIDLPAEVRQQVIPQLQQALFAAIDLRWQVKQAHWNIKGPNFVGMHELLDKLADEIDEHADELAERMTALAGQPIGNIRQAAQQTPLNSNPDDINYINDVVAAVADRYAEFARLVRQSIEVCDEAGDADTADLFTGISRNVDMRLWFLEAHVPQQTQ